MRKIDISEAELKCILIAVDYRNGWNDAVDAMHRWISVEERLPENGVHVLVTAKTSGGHKYVCDAFHAEKFSISSEYGDELACEYNPEKDEYFLEEGWYEVIKNWDDYSSIVIQDQVTHWMPLPELPEEAK
jgi:hypothetical protein